jgi:hypothetical protein
LICHFIRCFKCLRVILADCGIIHSVWINKKTFEKQRAMQRTTRIKAFKAIVTPYIRIHTMLAVLSLTKQIAGFINKNNRSH